MATTSGRRGLIAQEDTKYHDPTVGAVADVFDPSQAGSTQTFSRTSQSGGTVSRTKVSALNLPLIDAAVVAGAQSPFNSVPASLHNVEAALARIRTSVPHYLNLEHYGAQAGSGVSSGIAAKNTAVWNQLVSDIASDGRGGGIFVPAGTFEFGGSAPILEINSKSNLNIVGAGAGSVLKANAANADVLLRLTDCSGIQIADLKLDKVANTAGSITCQVRASAGSINNLGFYSVILNAGATSLKLDNASKHGNTFWVRDCQFDVFLTKGVEFIDWARGRITGCTFNGGTPNQMIVGSAPANGDLMLDCEIGNNKSFSAQKSDILVTVSGTYDSTKHSRMDIHENNISLGDITLGTLDQGKINENRLLTGRIVYQFVANANLNSPQIKGNYVSNSAGRGIEFLPTATAVFGLEISGGIVSGHQTEGIYVGVPGAATQNKGMRIYGVNVLNCSQVGNGNNSGILIDQSGGTGGTVDSIISNNVVVSTAAPKHKNGIEEKAGGGSAGNLYAGNVVHGYTGVDVSITAGSTETVGRDNGA